MKKLVLSATLLLSIASFAQKDELKTLKKIYSKTTISDKDLVEYKSASEALEAVATEESDKVYAKLAFSGKGQTVAEADRTRDHLFSGMKKFLKGYEGLPSLDNYQIAMDVLSIFKTYGLELDKLSYSSETAQMRKLIEELDKPEILSKITELNLITIFNQLKTAQTDFEAIYSEQAEANAELRQLPSASTIRKNLESAIKNYLALLTAMKNVDNWKLIFADINEIVKAAKNSTLTIKDNSEQERK